MGLVGIWEYEEQVFFFYGGKLILRGLNGSGKTKALEVTSPLLLDGILNARRLDPFGNAARSMRDNILFGGVPQRISYVWTEYGRVTESGDHEFLTVGIGMHALASDTTGLRAKWFFTTNQRVDDHFVLYRDDRRPRNRAELEVVLGKDDVHERAKHYREAIAKRLFGFSPTRLNSLVDLLLTLRRPKLSEDLTVGKLSELLSEGLPPVSGMLLEDLAGKFDELAREREELQDLIHSKEHIDTFLSSYARLARRVVRSDAEILVAAEGERSAARQAQRKKEEELAAEQERLRRCDNDKNKLQQQCKTLQTRITELRARPEMEQHGLITELQKQVIDAGELLRKAQARHQEATEGRDKAVSELEEEREALDAALQGLVSAERNAELSVGGTALETEHHSQRDAFRDNPESVRKTLMGQVEGRLQVLAQAALLAEEIEKANGKHQTATDLCGKLLERRSAAKETCDGHETALAQRVRELRAYLVEWAESCRQLQLTEDQLGDLVSAVPTLGEDAGLSLAELVAAQAQPIERSLTEALADLRADRKELHKQRKKIADERTRVAAQADPEPPAPLTPRRDRTAAAPDGSPLWNLLEFAPAVTDEEAAHLEAALLGAGLLDAWVTPDGKALSADTLEAMLVASEPQRTPARSLSTVLRPVDHPLVPASVTGQILASIALDGQDGPHSSTTSVGTDGTWRIGVLRGRTTGAKAAHIGAAARAAERQRRLESLDLQLQEFDGNIADLDTQVTVTRNRLDDLVSERNEPRHKDRDVREARQALAAARALLEQLDQEAQQAQAQQQILQDELHKAERVLEDYTRPRGIRPEAVAIAGEQEALKRYATGVAELFHAAREHLRRSGALKQCDARLAGAERQFGARTQELSDAGSDLAEKKEKLQVRRRLAGAAVDKVLAALDEATNGLRAAEAALDANDRQSKEVSGKVGALGEAVNGAKEQCVAKDVHYHAVLEDYRRLARRGYLDLAGANTIDFGNESAITTQARVTVEQLADEPFSEQARNHARNDADAQFRLLQAELAGPDWRPRAEYDGPLFVVTLVHNAESHTVPQTQDIMANEIDTRRGLLGDDEHELFTEVLLGRLGDHLRRRRAEAANLIERMNTLLQRVPTSSGHLMKLVWEPDPGQDEDVREALESLDGQSTEYLSDTARERLIRFLVAQVEAARANEGSADWRAHLREALDYRSWSRVRIRHKAGPDQKWTNLTDQKQQRGSGGEQAVALQLPLFVAAAAHYEGAAPTAPRPIYLDEAFAGVDTEMRGRCMGLLNQLDLDVVMASHDEWGFHKEVPKVATYQLFRHPALPGVLTTPILWDGAQRHDLPDPALRQDATFDMGIDWDDEEDVLDEEFDEDEDPTDAGAAMDDEDEEDSDDDPED